MSDSAVPAPSPDTGAVWHYGDPLGEQRAAATGAVVIDRSHRAVLKLTGPERQTWLHSISTQHVAALRGTNYGWRDQLMLKFKKPVWESRARMSGEIFSNAGLGMLWIEPALKGGANVSF